MKQLFQTVDGEVFDDVDSAREHEKKEFAQWIDDIETGKVTVDLKEVLVSLAHCDVEVDGYYGTPTVVLVDILKSHWESQ